MRGYVFLNHEMGLVYKPWEYINESDPDFFHRNRSHIVKVWAFDTEETKKFYDLVLHFKKGLLLPVSSIRDFLSSIGHLKTVAFPPLPTDHVSPNKSNED